jgi:hypothetical protein
VSTTNTRENYQRDSKIKHSIARGVKCKQKIYIHTINNGHAVTQLVKALSYKEAGRGFDSRCCHWSFSWTQTFRPHCGSGVATASNRNVQQEYFLGGKGGWCVAWQPTTFMCRLSRNVEALNLLQSYGLLIGLYRDCFSFTFYNK